MGLELSSDDITMMESRTEGWIVGLQMAALSMQGKKDKSGFIRAFTGSHRFILDYFVEEILNQQPPTIQEFLLRTSILERLSVSLCDTVTGGDESQRILTRLEQTNLFLIPLDNERRWYRYHHLFADLLHSRLRQTHPDLVPILHHRASDWYENEGLITEAVNHMLAASDIEQVTRLVEGNALTMMDHGELSTLAGWLGALPVEAVRARPWLCVAYAWVLAYTGQINAVEPLLQDAERAIVRSNPVNGGFDEATETSADFQRLTGHVAATRAYAAAVSGDMPTVEKLAREALAHLPQYDLTTRSVSSGLLGAALLWRGDLSAAAHALTEAITISQLAEINHVTIAALCSLAALQTMQGQLHKAVATCQDALHLTENNSKHSVLQFPVIGLAYARLSFVLLEWNDLESALSYAREGLELCKQWGQTDILITGYMNLAIVYQAVGDPESALSTIRDAIRVASTESIPYRLQLAALEAKLQLAQGNTTEAFRWVRERGLKINDELNYHQIGEYIVTARVLIAQGKSESVDLFARLLEVAETAGAVGHAIEILVLQAMFLQKQGESDHALTVLERALSLAQPEGYVRTFIDEGAQMGKLLRQAAKLGIAVEYTGKLLAALDKETKDDREIPQRMSQTMVDPLTERELEVMRLLTTHLSNTEIASELYISANTVRFHVKKIYNKLNVHRRADAVKRAKELRLV
jgi:LuxR family maltose regulon positive regulatory protein